MSSMLLCHSTIITGCNKLSKLALKFKSCCTTSMTHHTYFPRHTLLPCHTVIWYICQCNFIYAHERNMTFPALFFSKLGNAYVLFSISPKLDGSNVGSKNIPSLMPVSKDWLSMHQFLPNLMKILGMVPTALISTKLSILY